MNILPAIIPFIVFLLLWGIFYKTQADWRAAFLSTAVIFGVLLTAITEIFSLFNAIAFWPIFIAWSLCFIVVFSCFLKKVGNPKSLFAAFKTPSFSRFEWLLLAGVAFIVAVTGMIALIAPPNTSDSMVYHMARIMHWIQDRNVAFYPTYILRQLHQNPGAEFAILHLQVLSGGDRFANLVQWGSMIGSILGVSLLARQLGADARGQVFAAVISATIPMGILQASSTQSDYVVAFWLVCFTYFATLLKAKGNFVHALAAGASLGLAILTKATAYIFALPFMVWISLSIIQSHRAKGLRWILIIAAVISLLNLGHYARNFNLYGNPLGPGQEGGPGYKYANDIFTVPSIASNIVRNVGLHIGTFDPLDSFLEKGIYQLHRLINIDPNDPRTTWAGTEFHVIPISFSEDNAGNPLHLVLILISILLLAIQERKRNDTFIYFICLLVAFLLFCTYLRWQPWNSRLHLPLFILWSALAGLLLSRVQAAWTANIVAAILILGAIPWLVFGSSRPLIGPTNIFNTSRTQLYFKDRRSLIDVYTHSAQSLSKFKCSNIGLISGGDDWEYPFWVLLQQSIGKNVQMESVNVDNISAKQYHVFPQFTPCAVLAINASSTDNLKINGTDFFAYKSDFVTIFRPK